MLDKVYLGITPTFPIELENGTITFIGGEEAVAQSIVDILNTRKGSVILRPDYGSDTSKFAYYQNNSLLWNLLTIEAKESIMRCEPRVTNVDIFAEGFDNVVNMEIKFKTTSSTAITTINYKYYTNL